MKRQTQELTVSQVAKRTGVAASALRFYETKGLIRSLRTAGNQRRYHPAMLRTISVIQAAQKLGLTLDEIGEALSTLPGNRPPTVKDWERLSSQWRITLDQRIQDLTLLRDRLDGCIGCGCLSMQNCQLFNPDDELSQRGAGPRFLIDPEAESGTEQ
ncbi:redox-sensitive transcriptional activator SoxR [Ferrimonas aestuarii]|uniref:Redox-sensitive transcriptional activator SoxR n=1 Tax=Ferrimonas aestuarii TaxID=2569539 RepID=A0A4U1BEV6_9GAMM|nr:redox-sensitive transcriptional activator SoxR [Ferrimonas aestuarii]TKB49611.1 redox-sensitive transcriptional activator SoxR [Ferrimonas aestuarii]